MIACSTSIRCGSPLEAAVADVAALGFTKVDVLAIGTWAHVNVNDLAADPAGVIDRVRALLGSHGLTPVALNTGTTVQLWDRSAEACERRRLEVEALARLATGLGVAVAAIQPLQRDKARPVADAIRDAAASVREQVDAGAAAGVRFALELHVNSPVETMDEARQLTSVYPGVPLVYDPTHFVMQGVPIRETAWLMDRAIHVHLRDAARGQMQVPMGEGEVDFDWVLGTLKDRGYTGGFSIEYLESGKFDVGDSARRLRDRIAERFPG